MSPLSASPIIKNFIVTGKSSRPTYLDISAEGVEFRSADNIWGKEIPAVQAVLDGEKTQSLSAGGTLAWIMEATEKGLIDTDLKFGSPDGIEQVLKNIAYGRNIGRDMAMGTRYLSEKYGGKEFAIQIFF